MGHRVREKLPAVAGLREPGGTLVSGRVSKRLDDGGTRNAEGGQCDGAFSQDLNARWCPSCPRPGHAPTPGLQMQIQLWHRDPLNTNSQTTGLSDALEVDVCP